MSKQHVEYLANAVLGDERIITFRMLSRALGVNVNEAKRMLYDFSQQENTKKQSSIRITYVVTGTRHRNNPTFAIEETRANEGDGDVCMQEAPSAHSVYNSSGASSDGTIKTMTLVQDDQLKGLLSKYARVDSIHVYSVQSGPLKNLDHITSVYEHLYMTIQKEDPLIANRTYGVIQNPRTKHRASYCPPSAPEVHEDVPLEKSSVKAMFRTRKDNAKEADALPKEERGSDPPSSNSQPSERSATRPKTVKRESSDLFKSFAKSTPSKGKVPGPLQSRLTNKPTDSSAFGSHSNPVADLSTRADMLQDEDENMGTDGEGEEGEDKVRERLFTSSSGEVDDSVKKKSQKERDAELRKKIFDDEDDDDNSHNDNGNDDEDFKAHGSRRQSSALARETRRSQEDDEDMPEHPIKSQSSLENTQVGTDEEASEAEPSSHNARSESDMHGENVNELKTSVVNGRRRGRRRIVRKRMIKDAEGYLVTREEPGWESFSEEDVPNTSLVKGASTTSTPSSSAGAVKKTGSSIGSQQSLKKGQGNIMSFFGKGAKK